MIRLRAPAKLNLSLRVIGTRLDGFHEIETVFERIDLADELTFEPHPDTLSLTCTDPTLSCGPDNLVLQAATLLKQHGGVTLGARIHLDKRIPIAAGLGGGSSDAATTLLGLNALWGLGVTRPQLLELAGRLGSDVAFFLYEAAFAIGTGRGEVCQPQEVSRTLVHVVVIPDERLSTRDVYAGGRFDLTGPTPSIRMMQHALRNGSLNELAEGLRNDLEPEAIRRCPAIATIQSRLRASGCMGVAVSGSGPSVFGLCRDVAHAESIISPLRQVFPSSWRLEIVRTDRAPLVTSS